MSRLAPGSSLIAVQSRLVSSCGKEEKVVETLPDKITTNRKVMIRVGLFSLSTLILAAMVVMVIL